MVVAIVGIKLLVEINSITLELCFVDLSVGFIAFLWIFEFILL